MHFDGEEITALLATWRKMGTKNAEFYADECGNASIAYIRDKKSGATLQVVTAEGMRN